MSVRTELVLDQLVDRLLTPVLERRDEPPADHLDGALRAAGERLMTADPDLAHELARAGYRARVVEAELFAPAREPLPDAAQPLALADPERFAVELATGEPAGRPNPEDPQAASWRVPGPGGHVRHYLALRTIGALHAERRAERPLADPASLKRCWMYGFFLRCAEEAREATRTPRSG